MQLQNLPVCPVVWCDDVIVSAQLHIDKKFAKMKDLAYAPAPGGDGPFVATVCLPVGSDDRGTVDVQTAGEIVINERLNQFVMQ